MEQAVFVIRGLHSRPLPWLYYRQSAALSRTGVLCKIVA